MKLIPRRAALVTIAGVLACVVLTVVLLIFSTHDAQLAGALAGVGAVLGAAVGAAGLAVTIWLAAQARRETRDRDRARQTEIASGLPDSNPVAAQAVLVLAAVEDICSGRRTELDESAGQGRFIRRAIDQAMEALGLTESGQFREQLTSLGLDPSMLIGPLDEDERTRVRLGRG